MIPAASSPKRRTPEWNATRAGDFRFDISLIAIEIGLCPGFRLTTATFTHSDPRSMLDTADWDRIESSENRDRNIPNLINIVLIFWTVKQFLFG